MFKAFPEDSSIQYANFIGVSFLSVGLLCYKRGTKGNTPVFIVHDDFRVNFSPRDPLFFGGVSSDQIDYKMI